MTEPEAFQVPPLVAEIHAAAEHPDRDLTAAERAHLGLPPAEEDPTEDPDREQP
jgi:hypothetical protein